MIRFQYILWLFFLQILYKYSIHIFIFNQNFSFLDSQKLLSILKATGKSKNNNNFLYCFESIELRTVLKSTTPYKKFIYNKNLIILWL